MELAVFWTEFGEKELKRIFKYYKRKANVTVAKEIVNGVYKETLKLKEQPRIGQVEELFSHRKQEFRYLVYKSYKIVYWINESKNRIEINDVFDTRQNPAKIKRTQ